MTPYLDRILSGAAPTAAEWNEHVKAFHRQYPTVTSAMLGELRTREGETTYDYAARRLSEELPHARSILDLGCGDGSLLARIGVRYPSDVVLSGVDFSEDTLAHARPALPHVRFICADAADVSMGHSDHDGIVAHLSFMAMARSENVLTSIHAALKPRGRFIIVAEDVTAPETVFRSIMIGIGVIARRYPNFALPIPGRAPMERDEDVVELLDRAGLRAMTFERFVLAGALTPEQVWEFVAHTYPFGLLDPSLRDDAEVAVMENARESSVAGFVSVKVPLRFVVAAKES